MYYKEDFYKISCLFLVNVQIYIITQNLEKKNLLID